MDISPIGNGNYYIVIDKDEVRGCDVAELVLRNVSSFSRDTFLEIFSGTDGALVFARVRRGTPVAFSFPDIDTVISAAMLCDSECVAFLAFEADAYRLIYYPWEEEPPPAALYEFCASVKLAHPDYQRHIAEHGHLLLGPCAIEQLKKLFT